MAKTKEQLDAVRAAIAADAVLAEHGRKGRDATIADELNRVRDDVDVSREPLAPSQVLAMIDPDDIVAMSDYQTRPLAVLLLVGSVDLASPTVQAVVDVMPQRTRATMNAARIRKGSLAERDLGGPVSASDVSEALKADRKPVQKESDRGE